MSVICMALDAFSILFGIIDLLFIALKLAIPVFLVSLAALWLKKKLSERYSLSWIKSALITTYLVIFVLLVILHLYTWFSGYFESSVAMQEVPGIFAITPAEILTGILFMAIKIFLTAIILTILLLPLEFFAEFVSEKIKEKKMPSLLQTFIASYCTCLLTAIIVLFVFPWIIPGVFFLIYWG